MARFIGWFKDLSLNDYHFVGRKGAKLGELYNHNFPVPLGFVVTTDAFDEFLNTNNLRDSIEKIYSSTNINELSSLKDASSNIQNVIRGAKFSEALKKSILDAYHMLETGGERFSSISSTAYEFISVGRAKEPNVCLSLSTVFENFASRKKIMDVCTDQNLLESIKACWANLFLPQSILPVRIRSQF